jgi:hypothetical protein
VRARSAQLAAEMHVTHLAASVEVRHVYLVANTGE